MYHRIKVLAALFLVTVTADETFSVLFSNDTFTRAYGGFSPTDANRAANTFNDDRPKKSQSPDTDSTTTKANAQLDLCRHLLRHDDVTPMDATKIDAVNNAGM
jgi:hypothetical protein